MTGPACLTSAGHSVVSGREQSETEALCPVSTTGHSQQPQEAGRGGEGRGEAAGVPAARRGTFLSGPVTFIPGGQTQLQILARAAELVLNDSGKSVNPFGFHLKHQVVTWHVCLCSASACARLYFPNTLFRSHSGPPPRSAVHVPLAWNPSRPL